MLILDVTQPYTGVSWLVSVLTNYQVWLRLKPSCAGYYSVLVAKSQEVPILVQNRAGLRILGTKFELFGLAT